MKYKDLTIGYEFEGLVHSRDYDRLKLFCDLYHLDLSADPSIRHNGLSENGSIKRLGYEYNKIEISGFIFHITELNDFYKLIEKLFNEFKVEVNNSCGLHFHIRFKNKGDFFKLIDYDFIKNFQNKISTEIFKTKYEKNRINTYFAQYYNDNKQFKRDFKKQIKCYGKPCERYRVINFNSLNLHNTIEFRGIPATTNIKKAKKYINFVLDYTHEFLNKIGTIDITIIKKYDDTNDKYQQKYIKVIDTKENLDPKHNKNKSVMDNEGVN